MAPSICWQWLLVAVFVAVVAGPALAAGNSRIIATSDLGPVEALQDMDCPKSAIGKTKPGSAALSLEQALGNFNAALEGSVSPAAIRGLDASPAARNPQTASRLAATALVAEKPLATAALALRAHQAAPKDPTYLVNLAGVANYFGRYDEALAFANGAEALNKSPAAAWNMNGRAMLLSNKANALIGLGRSKEAEALLKEAIALQPDLSEAYTNMAYALGNQNRCNEAVRFMGAGRSRQPAQVLNPKKESETGKKQTETSPTEAERDKSAEETEQYLPADIAFDLSRGKRGLLPKVPIPVSLEEANASGKVAAKLMAKFQEDAAAVLPGLQAAVDAERRRETTETAMEDSGDLSARFSAERSRQLRRALSRFARDGRTGDAHLDRFRQMMRDSYMDYRRAEEKAAARKGKADIEALEKMMETSKQVCLPRKDAATRACELGQPNCETLERAAQACDEKVKWDYEQAQCKSMADYLQETAPSARAYDNWMRSYFHESYLYATAVASYLGHPDNQTYARFKLKGYELSMLGEKVVPIGSHGAVSDDFLRMCKIPPPPPAPTDVPTNEVAFCALPDNTKVTAGAAQVLEVAMNCEQVDVTASTPGFINLFVQVSYDKSERARKMADERARAEEKRANRSPSNPMALREFGSKGPVKQFDGTITVFVGVGVKGTAGAASSSAQAGAFMTVDHYGTLTGVGGMTSSSTSAGADLGVVSVGAQADTGGATYNFLSTPAPAG